MSSDQNIFMVVVRFLETFVGSMSAGLFLVPCWNLISLCVIILVYDYITISFNDNRTSGPFMISQIAFSYSYIYVFPAIGSPNNF